MKVEVKSNKAEVMTIKDVPNGVLCRRLDNGHILLKRKLGCIYNLDILAEDSNKSVCDFLLKDTIFSRSTWRR